MLDGEPIPVDGVARYLGLHLDCKLNWHEHIQRKRKMLDLMRTNFKWLINHPNISLRNKILVYKSIFRPAWSYGAEIWGTAADSNIAISDRFQNKFLRATVQAPWYVTNKQLHSELKVESVKEIIARRVDNYVARLHRHPNLEAIVLLDSTGDTCRLRRKRIFDL